MRSIAPFLLCALWAMAAFAKDPVEKCCFTNPAYSGTCAVTPAEDETCNGILDYLNNPNSTGKSYCGGTRIRGGWAAATCASKATGHGRRP
jgi:hypothetical protein